VEGYRRAPPLVCKNKQANFAALRYAEPRDVLHGKTGDSDPCPAKKKAPDQTI
jgi:hypothetical protein